MTPCSWNLNYTHAHARHIGRGTGLERNTCIFQLHRTFISHVRSARSLEEEKKGGGGREGLVGLDVVLQSVGGSGGGAVTDSFHGGDVGERCSEAHV